MFFFFQIKVSNGPFRKCFAGPQMVIKETFNIFCLKDDQKEKYKQVNNVSLYKVKVG